MPRHVQLGEQFPLKVQATGDRSSGRLLIYDETRECMFYVTSDMEGFEPLWDAVKAEAATTGTEPI